MNKFLLLLTLISMGCSHEGVRNSKSEFVPEPIPLTASGSDQPIINLPPDHHCSLYQGSTCVAPIVSLPPDQSCAVYDGTSCVAPIFQ